jgi:hypothetical protein
MSDATAPPHRPQVHIRVEGLRLTTAGLCELDHPELSLLLADSAEMATGRAVLLSLATDVVYHGQRFAAGEGVRFGRAILHLAAATLELWEADETGQLRRGASRLLAALAADPSRAESGEGAD